MKSRKLVFFLHFIIFSFAFLSSSSLKESTPNNCPNYFILNFSKIFSEKNISKPLSIWTKEYTYSDFIGYDGQSYINGLVEITPVEGGYKVVKTLKSNKM